MAYEWKIIDGDTPFLSEFPQMYDEFEPIPYFWNIVDGASPYRNSFPQMYTVNDVPLSLWKIIDGVPPYRLAFPQMYKYRVEKPYKSKVYKVIVSDYAQTIIVKNKNR